MKAKKTTKKESKNIEGVFQYGNESTLDIEGMSFETASVRISLMLNADVYLKLKEFTRKTKGKYQSIINEILKENVDNYLARQIVMITEEMQTLGKKYKIG